MVLPSLPLELCSLATNGTQEGEGQGWGLYLTLHEILRKRKKEALSLLFVVGKGIEPLCQD